MSGRGSLLPGQAAKKISQKVEIRVRNVASLHEMGWCSADSPRDERGKRRVGVGGNGQGRRRGVVVPLELHYKYEPRRRSLQPQAGTGTDGTIDPARAAPSPVRSCRGPPNRPGRELRCDGLPGVIQYCGGLSLIGREEERGTREGVRPEVLFDINLHGGTNSCIG